MPRKPAASAYILALTLRRVVRANEERIANIRKANAAYRTINAELDAAGVNPEFRKKEIPEDPTLFWADVKRKLDGLQDVADGLAIVNDADYRSILFEAVNQPYNKVRKSKGFQALVPVLMTLRRYGPLDERQPMGMTEDEARDLADLIWAQEMENFPHGVDPINKQIITNKVAKELKEENIKYIGEEIVGVEFNDAELDAYEVDHADVQALLENGIRTAFELFDYDPSVSTNENTRWVRHAVVMYNSMLDKDWDDDRIDEFVNILITVFLYLEQLIE